MRYLGLRHRVKKTARGEARPTQVAFVAEGQPVTTLDLATETDELDFVKGKFPIKHRAVEPNEDLSVFAPHHIRRRNIAEEEIWDPFPHATHIVYRPLKKKERVEGFPASHLRKKGKATEVADQVATHVPQSYDGLQAGDVVAMILGGSGDNLGFALARRGQDIGARVLRIPGFRLDQGRDREQDATTFARLAYQKPDEFYEVAPRDRRIIAVREANRARIEAMDARIACAHRLRQFHIGRIFCSEDGYYPEGDIEKLYEGVRASDVLYKAVCEEEARRERELAALVEDLPVYQKVFEPIEGVGPLSAARIIASVQDIRRFETTGKLQTFLGVHVQPDGRFPRRRSGETANWDDECRSKALYGILAVQFNKRPNTYWGQRLRQNKKMYRISCPDPIRVDKNLAWLFRRLKNFFFQHDVNVPPLDYKLETIDSLYEWYHASVSGLPDGFPTDVLGEWERQIKNAGLAKEVITVFSPAHIHKMAVWRTLTEFVEILFVKWWKLEGVEMPPKGKHAKQYFRGRCR